MNDNINIYIYYKFISNIIFINPEYIVIIFNIIKVHVKNNIMIN